MKLSTLALAGALALTGATASLAQPAPADRPGAVRMQRPDPAQRIERRAEHLRAALQLRPEQDAALRAFVETQRPPQGARQRMRGQRHEMAQATTPQRLERQRERMAERQAQFDRRAQATLRFYAQLSPSQQKAFDALRPARGDHMKRGGGRRGGGMGHGRG
jgi:Spy/CpxP family protein refolding chaperone